MPTKKRPVPKQKSEHQIPDVKSSTKKSKEKPASVVLKKPEFTGRLDSKDERSAEEIANELEEKQKDKTKSRDEIVLKQPPIKREVPHIDIPVVDQEESTKPAWHTVNDDLPSIARPTNVPGPIPPSQSLTSDPVPADVTQEVTAQVQPQSVASVTPISEGFLPIESKQIPVKKDLPPDKFEKKLDEKKAPKSAGSFWFFLIGVIVGVLVLLFSVWIYITFSKRFNIKIGTLTLGSGYINQNKNITPTPTVTPSLPEFDRSSITIDVINGSGVKGQAAEGAQKLTDKGYTILLIGNAPSLVKSTELYLKEVAQDKLKEIMADITALYPEATFAGTLSDTITTASARLVVGK